MFPTNERPPTRNTSDDERQTITTTRGQGAATTGGARDASLLFEPCFLHLFTTPVSTLGEFSESDLEELGEELEEEDLGPEGDGRRIDEDMVALGYSEL
jgi:hypothetical protein